MQKYTGNEAFYNIEDWEKSHPLSQEFASTKIAGKYIKSICKKLFSKKGGKYAEPDFFDEKFRVIVCDKDVPNAFHRHEIYNYNGCSCLAVTKELINFCQNEAELAAILAHELGHFEVYETKGTDVYGAEHETRADAYGFETLIQSGYDPNAMIDVYERIGGYDKNYLEGLDPHGSMATRVRDLKILKAAKINSGINISGVTNDNEYQDFKNIYQKAAADDKYVGLIEERLLQKTQKERIEDISNSERLNFVLDIVNNESVLLITKQRMEDAMRILGVPDVTKEDARLINQIIDKTVENSGSSKNWEAWLKYLPQKDVDGDFYIKPRGEALRDVNLMNEFMDDPEKALEQHHIGVFVSAINNWLFVKNASYNYIPKPQYKLDDLKEGDVVPWAKVKNIINLENRKNVSDIMYKLGVNYDYFHSIYGDSLGWSVQKKRHLFCDEKGTVVSTDKEKVSELISRAEVNIYNGLDNIENNKKDVLLDFYNNLTTMKLSPKGSPQYIEAKNKAVAICIEKDDAFEKIDGSTKFITNSFKNCTYNLNAEDRKQKYCVYSQFERNLYFNKDFYPEFFEVASEACLLKYENNISEAYDEAVNLASGIFVYVSDNETKKSLASTTFSLFDKTGRRALCPYMNSILSLYDVGDKENIPAVENTRASRGLKEVQNTDDLLDNLAKIERSNIMLSSLMSDYEIMRALNQGIDIDVTKLLQREQVSLEYRVVHHKLADKLTKYVDDKQLFAVQKGETNEQAYERCIKLYYLMHDAEAFSGKNNCAQKFENTIIDLLEQLPPEKKEAEAFKWLQEMTISFAYTSNQKRVENIYVDSLANKYGKDDNTQGYLSKIRPELEQIAKEMSPESKRRVCVALAEKVVSQKDLSFELMNVYGTRDIGYSNKTRDNVIQSYKGMDVVLSKNPELTEKTMDFLLSKGSIADCEKLSKEIAVACNNHSIAIPGALTSRLYKKGLGDNHKVDDNEFVAKLHQLHEAYKNSDYQERALIMTVLLDDYVYATPAKDKLDKQINYVTKKIFGDKSEEASLLSQVKTISKAVCHQEETPALLLGGVLSGREPGQGDEAMNVGEGLSLFCEKKGTAWVKLAQTLSYVDALPKDIRDSLGRLKGEANIPTRWDVFNDINEVLPKEEAAKITRVGKVIGSGTFFQTVLLDIKDEKSGEVQTKVGQFMQHRAANQSKTQFKVINGAIDELCKTDKSYEILKSIASRSAENAKIEVDINEGAAQYVRACENYGAIKSVELNGVSYRPKVATWQSYGASHDSCYKIMDKAPGKSIDSPEFTPEQKREMALAYITIEMANLLNGKAWDIDRHSKQQNFYITQDEKGKTVVEIGIFDTGAQRPAPKEKDKKLLGKFLAAVVKESKSEKSNLSEAMLKKIKSFEKAGKDVNYVSDVQRGLLAMSDIMQYLNVPEKNNDIGTDLMNVFGTLKNEGLIDEQIYKSLQKELVKTAIKNPKFGVKAVETILHPKESKDSLKLNMANDNSEVQQQISMLQHKDKAKDEIDVIEAEKHKLKGKEKILSPEEQVGRKLDGLGIERGSYVLLDEKDWSWMSDASSKPINLNYENKCKEKNLEMVTGYNNGVMAAYFVEGVYMVTTNPRAMKALYCDYNDVGIGVIYSNGEQYGYGDEKWKKAKEKGDEIYKNAMLLRNCTELQSKKIDGCDIKFDIDNIIIQSDDRMNNVVLSVDDVPEIKKYAELKTNKNIDVSEMVSAAKHNEQTNNINEEIQNLTEQKTQTAHKKQAFLMMQIKSPYWNKYAQNLMTEIEKDTQNNPKKRQKYLDYANACIQAVAKGNNLPKKNPFKSKNPLKRMKEFLFGGHQLKESEKALMMMVYQVKDDKNFRKLINSSTKVENLPKELQNLEISAKVEVINLDNNINKLDENIKIAQKNKMIGSLRTMLSSEVEKQVLGHDTLNQKNEQKQDDKILPLNSHIVSANESKSAIAASKTIIPTKEMMKEYKQMQR